MSRNWIRAWSVTVGGLQINPDLRIRFNVTQQVDTSSAHMELIVTNVRRDQAHQLATMVGKTIELEAGFVDNRGIIFRGKIAKVLAQQRENATDTAATFYAYTEEPSTRYGHVNTTLKSGSTGMDAFTALLKTLSPFGVIQGNIPEDALKKIKFPRAHVMYGDTQKHLRKLSQDVNGTHYYGNFGDLNITPADSNGSGGRAIKINSATGMIGLPVEQELGIIVTFLINPNVTIDSRVEINQGDIQELAPRFVPGGPDRGQEGVLEFDKAKDGIYVVVGLTWVGDSRGEPWYGTAVLNLPGHRQTKATNNGMGAAQP